MSRWIKMEPGYVCPLCPDHRDDVFIWNNILQAPICQGCYYELWNDVYDHEFRPESMLLDRLEKLTSLGYEEYRLIELKSVVADRLEQGPVDQDALEKIVAECSKLEAIINTPKRKEN